MTNAPLTINIQPPVSVYSTYRRLSYKPWYAIAEFVDNSTQNYFLHKIELNKLYKEEGGKKLTVRIQYDAEKNQLKICDNANGMDFSELQRAVVLNSPPQDTSGRCEFGMGLKTAACWFGRKWTIETTRAGLTEKYSITVDVEEMSRQSNETLIVSVASASPSEHYTLITIDGLYKPIQGRTGARIKDQLSSLYRVDLTWGEIEIWWGGMKLSFQPPPIFEEQTSDGKKVLWRKDIRFDVPWKSEEQMLKAKGWIALRTPGSQRDAGFVLLRRGRVIVGGPDNGYKPEQIFGQANSFRSQRLIGEINLDSWPITQAKDAFDWSGGLEDDFIEILKENCKEFMEKAEEHRVGRRSSTSETGQEIPTGSDQPFEVGSILNVGNDTSFPTLKQQISSIPASQEISDGTVPKKLVLADNKRRTYILMLHNEKWTFRIFWQDQVSDAHWMSVEYPAEREVNIYLNAHHHFFEEYLTDSNKQNFLHKIVIALAFAENLATQSSQDGLIHAADFRDYMNRVLRYIMQIEERTE